MIYHAREKTRVCIYYLAGELQPVTLAFHELETGTRSTQTFFPREHELRVKFTSDDNCDPVVLKPGETVSVEFTDNFIVSIWENKYGI